MYILVLYCYRTNHPQIYLLKTITVCVCSLGSFPVGSPGLICVDTLR